MTKIAESGSESGSGSICQWHGSADPDPDPPQNVMDPQHCLYQVITNKDQAKRFLYLYLAIDQVKKFLNLVIRTRSGFHLPGNQDEVKKSLYLVIMTR
jgi:hypothetical protein